MQAYKEGVLFFQDLLFSTRPKNWQRVATIWFIIVPAPLWRFPAEPMIPATYQKGEKMLETIAVILIVLWLLGVVTSYTMGGFIHILLVIAIVVVVIRIIQGRRVM